MSAGMDGLKSIVADTVFEMRRSHYDSPVITDRIFEIIADQGFVVEPAQPRMFPMQKGPPIPWQTAEVIYEMYSAQYGTSQSLERLAERKGFGWAEVERFFDTHAKLHRTALYNKLMKQPRGPFNRPAKQESNSGR